MHIRETLGCQRTDVFVSPRFLLKGLVMKAAAWGAFTFSPTYFPRCLVIAADRKTRAAGIVGRLKTNLNLLHRFRRKCWRLRPKMVLNVQSGGGITANPPFLAQ